MALRCDPNSKTAGVLVGMVGAIAAIAVAGWAGASPSPGVPSFDFKIEPNNLADELVDFFAVTGTSVLYDNNLQTRGRGVHGRYTAEAALTRMLHGTGLTCVRAGKSTIVVRQSMEADSDHPSRCLDAGRQVPSGNHFKTSTESGLPIVSILGTHIHGLSQIGSTVVTWDEEQIRRSGAHTVSDLLARLTQNFGGGPGQYTHFGQAETFTNSGLGTSANLRGLGARATLILLNGCRIAPSGSAASFVDLLNIPLSAVEAVEILLDGASAIYGSDAVGGVINIRTKQESLRPETFAELGSVTSGHQGQDRLSQELGAHWDGGHLVVVGEIMQRGALAASERWQNSSELIQSPTGLYANPGNLQAFGQIFAIPTVQTGRMLNFSTLVPGTVNTQDIYADSDIVPDQTR